MKKLNLLLLTVLFSSLLIGCGMKGPLYREVETESQPEETQLDASDSQSIENENAELVDDEVTQSIENEATESVEDEVTQSIESEN